MLKTKTKNETTLSACKPKGKMMSEFSLRGLTPTENIVLRLSEIEARQRDIRTILDVLQTYGKNIQGQIDEQTGAAVIWTASQIFSEICEINSLLSDVHDYLGNMPAFQAAQALFGKNEAGAA